MNAQSTRPVVSRGFLIRQAVLNAMQEYWPTPVKAWGVAGALDKMGYGQVGIDTLSGMELPNIILRQYRALTEQYKEAA